MGWAGGTSLFDGALDIFLPYLPDGVHEKLVEQWYDIVSESDWDTEEESKYWSTYLTEIFYKRGWLDD